MVPVPEMAAFAERYGFDFVAHEKGDANRSAHVERRFDYIETQLPRRPRVHRLRRRQRAGARLVRQGEREAPARAARQRRASCSPPSGPHLKPLPALGPEVYRAAPAHRRPRGLRQRRRATATRCPTSSSAGRSRSARPRTGSTSSTGRAWSRHAQRVLEPRDAPRVTLPEHRPPRGQASPSARARARGGELARGRARARRRLRSRRSSSTPAGRWHARAAALARRWSRDYPRDAAASPRSRPPRTTASTTSTGSSGWCSRNIATRVLRPAGPRGAEEPADE